MNKKIVAGVLALGPIFGGGAALASAAQDSTTTTATADANQNAPQGNPSQHFQDALKPLVDAGTITQAQADAVISALDAARPAHGGPGERGPRGGGRGLEAAAKALGIDADTLRTELQNNKSIAQVASEKGVDVNTVITAMVEDMKTHLAQEVTDGKLTQEKADQIIADATTRITEAVNTVGAPKGGPGHGPRGGQGQRADGQAPTDSQAPAGQ